MLNKLLAFTDKYALLKPGDHVTCAVSGGADSIALLYALYLLQDKLQISVSAAHFNHGLRGAESDADEAFVRGFCNRYEIPLVVGRGNVASGDKGLEAAARTARYEFLRSLPGKIATAHTANDNAETVLMHLIRGTGLRGLGGIMPCNGNVIRPFLSATRKDVLAFLEEHHLRYVEDTSNLTDAFFRNRLRHYVIPLLQNENPKFAESVSDMALRLRFDECVLTQMADEEMTTDIYKLRAMPEAIRSRVINRLLQQWGVLEPEAEHVALVEKLVFSERPSAYAQFPGDICITRNYGCIEKRSRENVIPPTVLSCPGELELPELGLRLRCSEAKQIVNDNSCFTVIPFGDVIVRSRKAGDKMCCGGGTKSLKELFIDKKVPAAKRNEIPVLTDDAGILGVYGFGADRKRIADSLPAVQIVFECI